MVTKHTISLISVLRKTLTGRKLFCKILVLCKNTHCTHSLPPLLHHYQKRSASLTQACKNDKYKKHQPLQNQENEEFMKTLHSFKDKPYQ